nr:two component transcriptional regulator, winged helix family domain protein [Rhodococcus sp. JVH1]
MNSSPAHPGNSSARKGILHAVWGTAYATETHQLWIFLAQLRRKLEPDPAHTRHLVTETGPARDTASNSDTLRRQRTSSPSQGPGTGRKEVVKPLCRMRSIGAFSKWRGCSRFRARLRPGRMTSPNHRGSFH